MTPQLNASAPLGRASTIAVLNHAWNTDVFLAEDAVNATGLTRSTTISAIDALIEAGLIRELPNMRADDTYTFGRPARRFELRAEAGLLVGIDAGRHHITTTISDLTGATLAQSRTEVAASEDHPAGRRTAVSDSITHTLNSAHLLLDDVVAVTVGVPAPVDKDGKSPVHADGFWENMNPGFQAYLEERFPIVRVENDAALAALAESTRGAGIGCSTFVSLLAGNRLGAGIFLDGRLAYGAHGGIGELEALRYVNGIGSTRGFVDLIDEWVRAAVTTGEIPAQHTLARALAKNTLTTKLELSHLRVGDPATAPIVEKAGRLLARICEILGCLYDPESVIMCGAIAPALDDVVAYAQRELSAVGHLPPPRILTSTLGDEVVSIGAIAAAREAAGAGILALTQ